MLDGRKLARLAANRARVRQGRDRVVTLVYRRPEATVYLAVRAVWRELPRVPVGLEGQAGDNRAAVRVELPLENDPRLVLVVADTAEASAGGVAAAQCFEVLTSRRAGIVPNRWIVDLKPLR